MNFSELYRQSNKLCEFSPSGDFLAIACHYKLIIRNVTTSQIDHLFSCIDNIEYIEWSSDSTLLLCAMFKRGLVQVWSLLDHDWTCKIEEGCPGLRAVHWSPDGRHILTTADFHLQMTIWSLTNKRVSYIRYPKECAKGYDYTKNGILMALAERRDCQDFVSIFNCESWELVKHFACNTEDLSGLQWSPAPGYVLAAWENLKRYKIVIYSADGRLLANCSPYEHSLGIKCVTWSPTGVFLAMGCLQGKIRILNHITWKSLMEKSHPTVVKSRKTTIYKEVEVVGPLPRKNSTAALFSKRSKYQILEGNVEVPSVKPDQHKANLEVGISLLEFSHNSEYFFTKNYNMPCLLWIWDVKNLSLSQVLIQISPIKCALWNPCSTRLALCTGSNKLFMWSPTTGCLSVEIPTEASFQVYSLKWHPDGSTLLLVGKEKACIFYLMGEDLEYICNRLTRLGCQGR